MAGEPFFFFFHIYEPHAPHDPPEPFASRYESGYDGEVAAADAVIGVLLDELQELDIYDSSIIMLTSDHGEGLYDHGDYEHGLLLYRESLQVPLLLKLPSANKGGTTVERAVGLIDVVPTIAALLDIDIPQDLPGRSLLAGEDEGEPRPIYSETFFPAVSLRVERAVLGGRPALPLHSGTRPGALPSRPGSGRNQQHPA